MALASSGITTSAVGNALGTTSRDVGALCTNSNINIWSRWKPIAHTATTMTWDTMKNANYGINVLSSNSPTTLFNNVKNNGNLGYTYNKPTNNFRLGDFRNYDHNASIPIDTSYQDGDKVNIGGVTSSNHESYKRELSGIEMVEQDNTTLNTAQTYISKSDIYTARDGNNGLYTLRRGALITDGTNTYWSTDYIPWAETNWQKFKNKTVTVFEFLTNTRNNLEYIYTANAEDRFFALPNPIRTISVTSNVPAGSKTVWVDCTCTFTDMYYDTISYSIQFSAVGDAYRGGTLTNVHIGYYKDNKGLQPIYSKKLADSITVENNGTSQRYFGTLPNNAAYSNGYILIYWNNSIQHTTMVMQEVMPQEE